MCVGMFVLVFCVGLQLKLLSGQHMLWRETIEVDYILRTTLGFCFCHAEQSLYTSCVLKLAMCLLGLGAPAVTAQLLQLFACLCSCLLLVWNNAFERLSAICSCFWFYVLF